MTCMRGLLFALASLLVAFILSCTTSGENHPGSIMGKFNPSGGTIKAGNAKLVIPPDSVTLTDTGAKDQAGDALKRGLTSSFTVSQSSSIPPYYLPGTVFQIDAVTNFDAKITSELRFSIKYVPGNIPAGYTPGDLVMGYAYTFEETDPVTKLVVLKTRTGEIEGNLDLAQTELECGILTTGTFYLKPRAFSGKTLSNGTTLTYRAGSAVDLTGWNPALPPWNVHDLNLGGSFQLSYNAPAATSPGVANYPTAGMAVRYDASTVFDNSIWGDKTAGLAEWPLDDGVFGYFGEVQDGIEVQADLVLNQVVGAITTPVTLSAANYPALRWTHDGLPVTGDLIGEGTITTSAKPYSAKVYRFSYLPGSPLGWTSYSWYAQVDGKYVPVAVIVSNNGNAAGTTLVTAFSRCTVFDLATALVY